jgi:hypothetical protein
MNTFSLSGHNALMMQVEVTLVSKLTNQVDYSRLLQFYRLINNLLGKNPEGKGKIMNQRKKMIMTAKKKVMRNKQPINLQLEMGEFKLALTYDQELLNNTLRRKSSCLHLIRMMSRWKTLYHWMVLTMQKSHRICKIRRRQKSSLYSNDSITFKRKRSC